MYNDDDDDEEYLCYREIDGAVGEFHDVYGYSTSDPFNTSFTNAMSDLASSPQQCSNLNFIAQPSTSADNISSPFHFNNDGIWEERAATDPCEHDELAALLAMNEAYDDILDNLIGRVTFALARNKEKQILIKAKMNQSDTKSMNDFRRKLPLSRFLPPYFRDSYDMEPPMNSEAKEKLKSGEYDPLIRAPRRWTPNELLKLESGVRNSIIEIRISPYIQKRELYTEKINNAGRETTSQQIEEWAQTINEMKRLINYHKNLPDSELLVGDYADIDWAKLAKLDFQCSRTPMQLRLKWINEQCPKWSKSPWSFKEIEKLRNLTKANWVNWDIIADKLGTRRTPFQCFSKFMSELACDVSRPWTNEEDFRLVNLVPILKESGYVPWYKVSMIMRGRSAQQCYCRYRRALDPSLKSGRWSEEEDLMLTCAVCRIGTKNWLKVASYVPGRSDSQCRERWVNVLDKNIKDEQWTVAEDTKLVEAINRFGRGEWSQIATCLPGRTPLHCKNRYRSLAAAKMRISNLFDISPLSILRPYDYKKRIARREKVKAQFLALLAADGNIEAAEQVLNRFNMSAINIGDIGVQLPVNQRDQFSSNLLNIEKNAVTTTIDDNPDGMLPKDMEAEKSDYSQYVTDFAILDKKLKHPKYIRLRSTSLLNADEKCHFDEKLAELENEEAKRQFLTDSLCNLIERIESTKSQSNLLSMKRIVLSNQIKDIFYKILIEEINDNIAENKKMMPLWPCIASVSLSNSIKAFRPKLCELTEKHFDRFEPGTDFFNIRLSNQMVQEPEYIMLKAKLRSLLFWPMMLDRAIESEESANKRVMLRRRADELDAEREKLYFLNQEHDLQDDSLDRLQRESNATVKDFLLKFGNRDKFKRLETRLARIDLCIKAVCDKVDAIYEREFSDKKDNKDNTKNYEKSGDDSNYIKNSGEVEADTSVIDLSKENCDETAMRMRKKREKEVSSKKRTAKQFINSELSKTIEKSAIKNKYRNIRAGKCRVKSENSENFNSNNLGSGEVLLNISEVNTEVDKDINQEIVDIVLKGTETNDTDNKNKIVGKEEKITRQRRSERLNKIRQTATNNKAIENKGDEGRQKRKRSSVNSCENWKKKRSKKI